LLLHLAIWNKWQDKAAAPSYRQDATDKQPEPQTSNTEKHITRPRALVQHATFNCVPIIVGNNARNMQGMPANHTEQYQNKVHQ
jgi:hypothetical protein